MTAIPTRLATPTRLSWFSVGVVAILVAAALVTGALLGPADIGVSQILGEVLSRIPGLGFESELSEIQRDILWSWRFPRVVLGMMVGGTLALSGAAYQGVFRNPLADPYLLGIAAGAALGATLAIVTGLPAALLDPSAFVGGVGAVVATFALGRTMGDRSATTLILAGVAIASFLTAATTFVQQRNSESLREVFAWILGRLSTSGWTEVALLAPYAVVSTLVMLRYRRTLDMLAVGDDEAASLGVDVNRVRTVVVLAATAGTAAAGLEKARELRPDLVLLDLRLPDRSGLELIGELKALDRSMLVVLMTAYGSVRDAVEAMRRGAADFLNKPIDVGELGLRIDRLVRDQRRERELSYLRTRDRAGCVDVLGDDPKLRSIFSQVERLCDAHLSPGRRPPILLMGETGAGKGVVAQQIHEMLGGGPLVEVSCASLPRDRVESELFGVERGNGSGPVSSEPGLFEAAEGGTLVLDEIVELDIDLQGCFLRAIENRQIRRVGSVRDRDVDVQILATTREGDLDACVAEGRLRPELLHRLRVLSFRIPPLRDRPADVAVLANHFAAELGVRYRGVPRRLSPDAIERLRGYGWPGNVRELRNVIERAVLLHGYEDLDAASISSLLDAATTWAAPGRVVLPAEGVRLEDVERDLLQQALRRTKGNQTRASALVGLSRDTLRYRVAKLGLDKERVSEHL